MNEYTVLNLNLNSMLWVRSDDEAVDDSSSDEEDEAEEEEEAVMQPNVRQRKPISMNGSI